VAAAGHRLARLPAGLAVAHEPAIFSGEQKLLRGRSDQAHLTFAFPAPCATDPRNQAARLFADIVGGGASSRLFQTLREERGLAYSVSASVQAYADIGILSVHAATSADEAVAAAALIAQVLDKAASDATDRELNRAKTQARASLMMSLESSWGQANYLARQLAIHRRLVEPAELIAAVEAVTIDDVRAAGRAMLDGPRASAFLGVPAARAA
jgi:predicted Zn-dependent peptidase